jgi:hypothetical protein
MDYGLWIWWLYAFVSLVSFLSLEWLFSESRIYSVISYGFGVWGSGFGVWGSGFGVWGSGFGGIN